MSKPDLADLTSTCHNLLTHGWASEDPAIQEWFENRLADFNLWTASLRVLSEGHASLQWRLRNRPDIRDTVADLLEDLIESLNRYLGTVRRKRDAQPELSSASVQHVEVPLVSEHLQSGTSPPRSISPWSGPSDDDVSAGGRAPSSPLEASYNEESTGIEVTLDQLFRIAIAIRKSGSQLRYDKADRDLDLSRYQELIDHLTFIILRSSIPQISSATTVVHDPGNDTLSSLLPVVYERLADRGWLSVVQRRLIAANVKRRHRFIWASQHEKRFIPSETKGQSLESLPTNIRHPRSQDRHENLSRIDAQESQLQSRISHSDNPKKLDKSITSASDLGSAFVPPPIPTVKSISIVSKVSATGESLHYPHPPRLGEDRKIFECPYCHQGLPRKYALKGWRGHVLQDLRPYSCVFEQCSQGDELFVSSNDWLQHMRNEHAHRCWICPLCTSAETTSSGKGFPASLDEQGKTATRQHTFSDEDALLRHIESTREHQNEYTKAQLSIIVRNSMRLKPLEFDSCPLCPAEQDGDLDEQGWIDHIARHLHDFSLRALPWEHNTNDETSAEPQISLGISVITSSESEGEGQEIVESLALLRDELSVTINMPNESSTAGSTRAVLRLYGLMASLLKYLSESSEHDLQAALSRQTNPREAILRCSAAVGQVRETLDELNAGNQQAVWTRHLDGPQALIEANTQTITELCEILSVEDPFTDSSASVPLLVAPAGFRPNSIFVGFQEEMKQLRFGLLHKGPKMPGTSAVLLIGPPGSGKTHLAREFVWQSQATQLFPGGIFWVNCASHSSLHQSFWEIGRKFELYDGDVSYLSDSSIVSTVKKYLENVREQWLIVFDGLSLLTEDDIEDFRLCIPDRRDSSVLFTSRDLTLVGQHRLLDPRMIRVLPLSQIDAQNLLYRALHIEQPNLKQREKAAELVKHYSCLPLAIHAIAHTLIATGRRLEQYRPVTVSDRLARPFADILTAISNESMRAYNLINLLCFLKSPVPIDLITSGHTESTTLEFPVDLISGDAGFVPADLDISIATLMKHGIVEHNLQHYDLWKARKDTEEDDGDIWGQESEDSTSMSPAKPFFRYDRNDSVDVLITHTVMQAVGRYSLSVNSMSYELWLQKTSVLLLSSFSHIPNLETYGSTPASLRAFQEYMLQAETVLSHFPKNRPQNTVLASHRSALRDMIHDIQNEIKRKISGEAPSGIIRNEAISTSNSVDIGGKASRQSSQEINSSPVVDLPRSRPSKSEDGTVETRGDQPQRQYHSLLKSQPTSLVATWVETGQMSANESDSPYTSSSTIRPARSEPYITTDDDNDSWIDPEVQDEFAERPLAPKQRWSSENRSVAKHMRQLMMVSTPLSTVPIESRQSLSEMPAPDHLTWTSESAKVATLTALANRWGGGAKRSKKKN